VSDAGSHGPSSGEEGEGAVAVATPVGDGALVAGLAVAAGLDEPWIAHELATTPTRSATRIELLARAGVATDVGDHMQVSTYPLGDDPSLIRSSH
jgi:hypothetical protein